MSLASDCSSKLNNNVIPDPWLKQKVNRFRSSGKSNWMEGHIINRE